MAWQYAALAGFQLWSSLQQAQMYQENARIQQQVADMNAKYAEIDAYNLELATEAEIAAYQPVIDQTVAEQRAGYAEQDVDVNYGTAAEVQAETRLTGFMNQLKMRQEGRARAMGIRNEAGNYRLGGATARAQGEMNAFGARLTGYLGAAQTGMAAYSRNSSGKKTSVSDKTSTSSWGV